MGLLMTAIQVVALGAAVAVGRSSQRRKVADLQTELDAARTNQEDLRSQLRAALSELEAPWRDEAGAADGERNPDAEEYAALKAAATLAQQHVAERDQEIENLKSCIANLQGQLEAAEAGRNLGVEEYTGLKAEATLARQHVAERDQEIENLKGCIADLQGRLEAARQDAAEAAEAGQDLDAEEYTRLKAEVKLAEDRVAGRDRVIEDLENRVANKQDELDSVRADFWREQQGNEVLERELERAETDASKRVSSAKAEVLHLHAEILDLQAELDAAVKIDQVQKAEINNLSRRLGDAQKEAAALADAEKRADEAEAEGVSLLAELEQAQQRAREASRRENELTDASVLIERANRARDQLRLEMKSQKAQHAEEAAGLRSQRDDARKAARQAKEERDVPAAMKVEMEEKTEEISRLKGDIDARDREIDGKDKEIGQLNNRLAGAERRADRAEQDAKETREERDRLQGEIDDLRKTRHNQNMQISQLQRGVAAEAAPTLTLVEPIAGDGIREAVLGAVPMLDGVAIPESALQHIEALDRESREGWQEKVLGGLWALNDYAKNRGGFPGNYYQWVQQGMGKDSAIGAKNVAMKDSKTTAAAKTTSEARVFEIDPMATGDSWMQMEAHLKFGTGTPNAPRIYFYDDTRGLTGKVHVGFIGPHSKVPTSGGF